MAKGLLKLLKKMTHKKPGKRLKLEDLLKDKWVKVESTKKKKEKSGKKEKKDSEGPA